MSSPAANDSEFAPARVRLLTLNRGAELIVRDGEEHKPDELWNGTAFDESGADVGVIARISDKISTVAELCCASIGRALELPIPEPFLVWIEPAALPASRFLDPAKPGRWCFASGNLGGESFAQLLRSGSESAVDMLRRWPLLAPVSAFDEWMANPDRNLGNIIYAASTLHLIDHADALGGSVRDLVPLAGLARESFTNKLADALLANLPTTERDAARTSSRTWLDDAARVPVDESLSFARIDELLPDEKRADLLDFLVERLRHAHALLCNRLGFPQLPLLPIAQPQSGSAASGSSSTSPPA